MLGQIIGAIAPYALNKLFGDEQTTAQQQNQQQAASPLPTPQQPAPCISLT